MDRSLLDNTLKDDDSLLTDGKGKGVKVHVQIGTGKEASAGNNKGNSNDEELTSLTWLQNNDFLQCMNILSNPLTNQETRHPDDPKQQLIKIQESSFPDESEIETSWDDSNPSCDAVPNRTASGETAFSTVKNNKESKSAHIKPPHSFSVLIFLAIESSAVKALPVRDIYSWIIKNFPYYRSAPLGWKNSVRHNLSLNRCFCKFDNRTNVGKGSLWMVDPVYRPQLIQSLCKLPQISAGTVQKLIDETPSLRDSSTPVQKPHAVNHTTSPSRSNIPDPQLFPYLSRHLARSKSTSPDVDAARAMLALGQTKVISTRSVVLSHPKSVLAIPRKSYPTQKHDERRDLHQPHEYSDADDSKVRWLSSNSSDDHTYSFNPRPTRWKSISNHQANMVTRRLIFAENNNNH